MQIAHFTSPPNDSEVEYQLHLVTNVYIFEIPGYSYKVGDVLKSAPGLHRQFVCLAMHLLSS